MRDRHDRSGIWFFSLDAARLPAVLAARVGYWLPYFWSDVSVRVTGSQIGYRCRRRRPGRGARCDAEVAMGLPLTEAERDEAALFLTACYRLFTMVAGRLASRRGRTSSMAAASRQGARPGPGPAAAIGIAGANR